MDDGVGCAEEVFEVGFAEDVPMLEGYPVGSGEIWCGDDAFDLEEFVEAVWAGGEGEDGFSEPGVREVFEVQEGEHLAANGLVGYPEDEVVAPLPGLDDVREGQEIGTNSFGVHDVPPPPLPAHKPFSFIGLRGASPAKFVQRKGLRPNSSKQRI